MARKKQIDENTKEIKTKLTQGKLVLGSKLVIKGIHNGTVTKVFLAANSPTDARDEIERDCTLTNTPLITLDLTNEELGVLCKKNFFVSALGIIGE